MAHQHPSIAKLKRLAQGEEYVYYRGRLVADIECSRPKMSKNGRRLDGGAPSYLTMLESLRDTVLTLSREEKVVLIKRKVMSGRQTYYYEYVAVGT